MNIDKVVNQHMAEGQSDNSMMFTNSSNPTTNRKQSTSSKPIVAVGEKTRVGNREVQTPVSSLAQGKRGRGRPRLTEEEKLRRRELRDLGLMKRSKRRTKEGLWHCVQMWVALF